MNIKKETQKYLAFLAQGVIDFCENISKENLEIPVTLERGFSGLKAMAIVSNEHFSTHLSDLHDLINKPISEWNYKFIDEAIDGFRISEYMLYKDYIDEDDEDEEYTDKLYGAYKIKNNLSDANINEYFSLDEPFNTLRNSFSTQTEYEIFRTGLSNSLLKRSEISKVFKGLDNKALEVIKEYFYKDLNPLTQVYDGYVYVCPECGYPMEKRGHHFYCPMKKCEDRKKAKGMSMIMPLEKVKANGLKVLAYDMQAFIKIPGIAEDELISLLEVLNKKYNFIEEITKYPSKDLADVLIKLKDDDIDIIDVKDYRDPLNLVKSLNENNITIKSKVPKYTNAYIIIPDYLCSSSYKKLFEDNISNKKLKILSVSEYIDYLKNKFKVVN